MLAALGCLLIIRTHTNTLLSVDPATALIDCRMLLFAPAMLLWGANAFTATLVPRDLAIALGRNLQFIRVVAIGVVTLVVVVMLPLNAAVIGEGWEAAVDAAMVRQVLFDTHLGLAWQLQSVAALVLAVTLMAPARLAHRATALAAGLLLTTLPLGGHAAMHAGWLRFAHALNDAVHLLSAGAWLGALVPLLVILVTFQHATQRKSAVLALRRFSTTGHLVVAVVIATGIVNTALVLGRLPNDWSSSYQALLLAKIAVVAVLVLIALVNRYLLVPHMKKAPDIVVRLLVAAVVLELILCVGAIGLVSLIGTLDPI
jgi:copper resistance protein D